MMNTIQNVTIVVPVFMSNWYVLFENRPFTNKPPTNQDATSTNDNKIAGNDPSQPVTFPTVRVSAVLLSSGWAWMGMRTSVASAPDRHYGRCPHTVQRQTITVEPIRTGR